MIKKKGQVTIFIILGLVFLITLFLLINFRNNLIYESTDSLIIEQNTESIKILVESCIKEIGEKAIQTISYFGGYNNLIEPYFEYEGIVSNYLYYIGEKKSLTIEEVENNLAELMNGYLLTCLPKDFDSNDKLINYDELVFQGLEIETKEINTVVNIKGESIEFIINWPLTIKTESSETTIEDFSPVEISANLKQMITFTDELMTKIESNPHYIDLFFILQQNFTVDLSFLNNDTYLIEIVDDKSIINDETLYFQFATKLNLE